MKPTLEQIQAVYDLPFFELLKRARAVYEQHWNGADVQLCTLLSIKTGGCSENCGYCAQSGHHKTKLKATSLLPVDEVLAKAREARENGSTRFCMGAAWKGIREDDPRFEEILDMIRGVSDLGLEACVTLGQISEEGARRLKEAGLDAYNHNIDTSPEHYSKVTTSHTFQDRLNTIANVQKAGINVCCGGILGLGENVRDRLGMLLVLSTFDPVPESIPINTLEPIPGTPLEDQKPVDIFELVRMIATTRIFFPASKVRLSAGRSRLSREAQALCFFAGANSIFYGEKLLTAPNPESNEDLKLLTELNLVPQAPAPAGAPVA